MIIKNQTTITLTSQKDGKVTIILDTNKQIVGKVVAGIPITECVDDSIDSLVITIKCADKTLYEPFDVVTLTVTDEDGATSKDMVVGTDNLQSYQPRYMNFTHVVQLFELTKLLEKTKIFSLNLTNTKNTLLQQFEKALNNAELLVSGESYVDECRFKLSDNLRNLLSGKPSEDFWFSNTDLRTVLDTMLNSSNARSTIEKVQFNNVGDIDTIVIGFRALGEVKTITPEWTRSSHGLIVNEEQQNNCQDYAGKIIARGMNTYSSNIVTMTDVFKSCNADISDKSASVFLPFPIGERGFEKFIVRFMTGSPAKMYEVDVSSRFIVQEQFDLFSDKQALGYLPFKIGSTMIPVGEVINKTLLFPVAGMLEAIKICAQKQHTITFDTADWWNFDFTYTYRPIIDTAVEITKPNTYDRDTIKMGIMASQTENTLDIARHGRQLAGLIKRTGNAEWYIDVEATYYRRLLPLMSKIDDGYVVYKREVGIYDQYVKCRYYLSKDYNAVETKAGVNRERHLYDIPLESDECPLLLKQYLVFSKKQPTEGADRTFKTQVIKNALATCAGQTADKINFLLMRSKSGYEKFPQDTENSSEETPWKDEKYRFVRPTLNYGQAKTMNFVASVLDNYSVDYSRDGYVFSLWGDGGHRMTYCRYVGNKATTAGECDRFELDFAFKCNFFENPDKYDNYNDLVKSFPISDSTEYVTATNQPFTLKYYKDRTQRPVFFTSLECIPAKEDFDNLVIGSAFCRDNCLVTGEGVDNLALYYSKDGELHDGIEMIGDSYKELGDASKYYTIGTGGTDYENVVTYDTAAITGYVSRLSGWSLDNGEYTVKDNDKKQLTLIGYIGLIMGVCEIALPSSIKLKDELVINYDSLAETTGNPNAELKIGLVFRGTLEKPYHEINVYTTIKSAEGIPQFISQKILNVATDTAVLGKPTHIFLSATLGTWVVKNIGIGREIKGSEKDAYLVKNNYSDDPTIKPRSWAIGKRDTKELYIGANGDFCNIYARLQEFPKNINNGD